MKDVILTKYGNLSYTARRVSPVGLKTGSYEKNSYLLEDV